MCLLFRFDVPLEEATRKGDKKRDTKDSVQNVSSEEIISDREATRGQ